MDRGAHHSWRALILMGACILINSCSADGATRPSASSFLRLTPNLVINRAAVNGRLISAFIYYNDQAPNERLFILADSGLAASAGEISGHRMVAAVLQAERVAGLRSLPWVDSIVLGSDDAKLGADAWPWGVDSIDADLVHSQLLVQGSGVNIAVLEMALIARIPILLRE